MRPQLLSFFLFGQGAFGAGPNTITNAEKAAGWRLLFDGKTYKNWRSPDRMQPASDSWTIADGCIKANRGPKIREDLISAEKYRDFELTWEWRISEGGNSGVKYRIQKLVWMDSAKKMPGGKRFEETVGYELENHPSDRSNVSAKGGEEYVVSFEYQMIDNDRHADAKRGPLYQTGALYSIQPPSKQVAKPVGEFNQSRLIIKGNHVEHWLNGEKVIDAMLDSSVIKEGAGNRWKGVQSVYDLLVNQPERDCHFSLQNHNDEVWFRDIKIRRL